MGTCSRYSDAVASGYTHFHLELDPSMRYLYLSERLPGPWPAGVGLAVPCLLGRVFPWLRYATARASMAARLVRVGSPSGRLRRLQSASCGTQPSDFGQNPVPDSAEGPTARLVLGCAL
jgi:hypothetical protein